MLRRQFCTILFYVVQVFLHTVTIRPDAFQHPAHALSPSFSLLFILSYGKQFFFLLFVLSGVLSLCQFVDLLLENK